MKLKLTFFILALLSFIGAKADVIPSSYYSEPAAGTFYLYNVTQDKFLERLNNNFPGYRTTPVAVTLASSNGNYTIQFSDGMYLHTGYWNNQYLWTDGESAKGTIHEWSFDAIGGLSNTYQLKRTVEETLNRITGTFYANGTNAAISPTDDCQWALITESDYNKYYYTNLVDQDSSIPSKFFTLTPTEGTYYLYNIEKNGFICDGNNYVGLQSIPVALTIISDGAGAFYIQLPDNGYIHTGYFDNYHVWADGGTTTASGDYVANWAFESFHGVSGVFFIKSPETTVNGVTGNWHLHATGYSNKGVNAWTTPDANRTNYAWALISEENYTAWQNSFVLDEATGYTATSDVYNVNPTVKRAMTANVWNTLVVPFDMAIPSGWTVVEPTSFSDGTLSFGTASSIEAGKPYLVKPTSAVTSFTATDVTLKKDLNPTAVGTGTTVTMSGTYTKIDAVPEGSYVLHTDNKLYKVNSTVSLKPFRAYFTVSDPAAVKANVISLNFDGETTGVNSLSPDPSPVSEGSIYNLAGQRMSKLQRGVNIVNGKKVSVK